MSDRQRLRLLFRYRELLWNLALRDVKARYSQSLLGCGWAVFQPLAFTLVFTLVFARFARLPADGIPYPLFAFAGLLPWTFFANSLTFAAPSLVNNHSLLTKIYFPREIFPLASVLACLLDFAIALGVFITFALCCHVAVTWHWLLLPAVLLLQVAVSVTVCMPLSLGMVFFRDIRFLIPVLMQLWMFACPIFYPLSMVPEAYRAWYLLNPMAGIIDAYRELLLHGRVPEAALFLPGLAVSALGLVVSSALFKKLEMRIADVL